MQILSFNFRGDPDGIDSILSTDASEPMKIYVAGPYSADTEEQRRKNTENAIHAGLALFEKGHYPFIPHTTHYVEEYASETDDFDMTYEDYLDWDEAFLLDCDALLHLASSPGADRERRLAEKLGMEIYNQIEDVPEFRPENKETT
jgi:hypothetical protein